MDFYFFVPVLFLIDSLPTSFLPAKSFFLEYGYNRLKVCSQIVSGENSSLRTSAVKIFPPAVQ